jgi:hypothetical protein
VVIQNLFGNLLFRDEMVYTAEKHLTKAGEAVYSEMHWSNWWWETQVRDAKVYKKTIKCS